MMCTERTVGNICELEDFLNLKLALSKLHCLQTASIAIINTFLKHVLCKIWSVMCTGVKPAVQNAEL